jgi:hypothetical protein
MMAIVALISSACSSSGDDEPEPSAPSTDGSASTAPPGTVPATPSSDEATSTVGTEPPAEASPTTQTVTTEPTATEPPEPKGTVTVAVGDQMLTVPAGYTISIFAEELGAARFMALDDDGVVYVTDRRGRVLRLPDQDRDGVADDV